MQTFTKLEVNKNAAKTDKKKASRTKLLIQDKSCDEPSQLGNAEIQIPLIRFITSPQTFYMIFS